MKKLIAGLIFMGILAGTIEAQFTRYLVKLKDKNGTPYSFSNPTTFLSQRANDRRTKYNIPIDSTDLPVNPSYLAQIKNVPNVTILNVSKWLNAITIQTSDNNAITTINSFPFVASTSGVAAKIQHGVEENLENKKFQSNFSDLNPSLLRSEQITGDYYNYGTSSFNEIHLHNGEFLHNIGLRGQGMEIAMLDNGFNNYTSPTLHAFDSANANNQVLGTWDFVSNESTVSNDGTHGMTCFSTIVANIPGQFVGKAPRANFWLFQTEDNSSETVIEEFNWSCGAERADSSGADVISTSLGYSTFDSIVVNSVKQANPYDHSYADLNGNKTMAVIAADLAAKKGMLVFAAVGNSGTNSWHYLDTPSDGDSVIAVGAVSSGGIVGSFSSYGPSSDGQVKPDLASVGVGAVIQSASGSITTSNGTSFACPKMAGLATCLWQGFPEFDNMKIRSALWLAGDSANNPNNRTGYGVPDMKKAFIILLKEYSTATGTVTDCKSELTWTSKDVSAMKYEIERKLAGEPNYTKIYDIPAQSNTTILTAHSYQKNDILNGIQAGTVSYRIRQILDTASASFTAAYIDTVDIALASSCAGTSGNPNAAIFNIVPNPARDLFTLTIETSYPINRLGINIFDMNGRMVSQFVRSKSSGTASYELPIPQLPKAKYIVSVYDGTHRIASRELIKL